MSNAKTWVSSIMGSALTVVIITRNEEQHISRAIRSVAGIADEILVVDSESTDRTREIAKSCGAHVHVQPWLGWVRQKNHGAGLATNDWILFVDADEIVTPQLGLEIKRALDADPDPRGGFAFERQEEFLGSIMLSTRRNKIAKRFIRVFNRRFSHWDDSYLIHEGVYSCGQIQFLSGKMLHWRNYTINDQLLTLNNNAEFEAKTILMKKKISAIPMMVVIKPILRFLWVYIACGNWRLGMRGYLWASMNATGEFLRQAKAWEATYASRTLDPPACIYHQTDTHADARLAER